MVWLTQLWQAIVKWWHALPEPDEPLPVSPSTMPPEAPKQPQDESPAAPAPSGPDSYTYPWDGPVHNWHNVRVLCDEAGLTPEEKNLISACIYQESRFDNNAVNHNRSASGAILSTDYGICQVNDYYHIGAGKDFPSLDYVLGKPAQVVAWMIGMYKNGMLKQWVSYSSGAYKQWIIPTSPMWGLANAD